MNVSLWQRGAYRWAFTERGRASVARSPEALAIGPSTLRWDGAGLVADLCEWAWPIPRRIRGRVRVLPAATTGAGFALDGSARHRWWPIAPHARVEVELDRPALRWSGTAYVDANAGDEPLEAAFRRWTWSRASLADRTLVFYDLETRAGETPSLALEAGADGRLAELADPPPPAALPRTRWRLERRTRADAGTKPVLLHTLEDGPFYARSVARTRLAGGDAPTMQESLSLDRLTRPWTRVMVPYRNPRAPWATRPR